MAVLYANMEMELLEQWLYSLLPDLLFPNISSTGSIPFLQDIVMLPKPLKARITYLTRVDGEHKQRFMNVEVGHTGPS
jgi:hypothetical protein